MSLEDLMAETAKRGLRINNLFQLSDGRWQANITDGTKFWDFGKGPGPKEALAEALHLSTTERFAFGIETPSRVVNQPRNKAVLIGAI